MNFGFIEKILDLNWVEVQTEGISRQKSAYFEELSESDKVMLAILDELGDDHVHISGFLVNQRYFILSTLYVDFKIRLIFGFCLSVI